MNILNDLFIGWKIGVLGRLKFFLYSLLMLTISLLTAWVSSAHISGQFAFFIYWLGLILTQYCNFLVTVKRYRELVPFPVLCTIIHWIAICFAYWKGQEWLILICGIAFLILVAAPGRRILSLRTE